MLNWGDKDSAERLAAQLKELLRDRTMNYDQLASIYSIKHGQSVTQRLKEMSRDRRPVTLADFIRQMNEFFDVVGKNQVRAKVVEVAGGGGAGGAAAGAAATARPPGDGKAPGTSSDGAAESGAAGGPKAPEPLPVMKYANVSRGVREILNEQHEPLTCERLEELFLQRFFTSIPDIVGMTTGEYLLRKENVFDYCPTRGTVFLQSAMPSGVPVADPSQARDEAFVVHEFEQLIEAMGPVVYISTLCGKFIQRNGISVTSIINTRPLDLFKRHQSVFLILGAGNVALKKHEHCPEVSRFTEKTSSKAQRIARAAEEAQLPVPDLITEQHVVEEFRRLILSDETDSVYISSLCGRFLQRFKKPVTQILNCKPAEFLRRYPDIFVMTGGGNVGLREVLGPDAVSVPPPPPRLPKTLREEQALGNEAVQHVTLTDELYGSLHSHCSQPSRYKDVVQLLVTVCQKIRQSSFLALEEVVLAGAAGKGLLTEGPQAEIVLFVRQLPYRNFGQWLPHILETLSPVLEHQLTGMDAQSFKVEKDHLHFGVPEPEPEAAAAGGGSRRLLGVQVYLSPVFKSREHLLECIRAAPPAERLFFNPAMAKERNEFVGAQPTQTKQLIRLLTWWASKQRFSSAAAAPSDWLVELVVIHASRQLREEEDDEEGAGARGGQLAEMVARVLEVFANFESIKVLWADTGDALYSLQDIWRPLLSHEPLFMDPLNPYCNLADAGSFDARELVAAAQPPGCLRAFKREVAQLIQLSAPDGEEDVDE